MSSQMQLRRGSTLAHSTFTGAAGETTFNTDTKALVTHDGATQGGFPGGGFLQAGASAVVRGAQSKMQDFISVFDFMTTAQIAGVKARTLTSDLSVPVQAAINAAANAGNKMVWFPAGTYYFNVACGNVILAGEGTNATVITPYSTTIAAVTYTLATPYWASHKEVRNIKFNGQGTKLGQGVALGITDITQINFAGGYTSNNPGGAAGTYGSTYIQYSQGVKFVSCEFANLNKGIVWGAGNIGSELYACSFHGNKYGAYLLDNKGGGDGMQSGCKFFYGGEFSSNEVAIYSHNSTVVNGQITLDNVIIEYNSIGIYSYNSTQWITPFVINNLWQEGNGSSAFATAISVDQYSGSGNTLVKTTANKAPATFWFEGDGGRYHITNSFVGDIQVTGENSIVWVENSTLSGTTGCSGGPFIVTYPKTSQILVDNSYSACGPGYWDGVTVKRLKYNRGQIDNNASSASRAAWGAPRREHIAPAGYATNKVKSVAFTSAENAGGTYNIVGTLVSDGNMYAQCNEFSVNAAFGNNDYETPSNSTFTTPSAGYYVTTVDVKAITNGIRVAVWDRNAKQWYNAQRIYTLNKWFTIASVAYSAGGDEMYLDFGGVAGSAPTTWRVSAFQVLRFDTEMEAMDYLQSLNYVAP